MSDVFKVEDSKINSDRRGYKLDTDLMAGFKLAVRNNQPSLALEYLVHMMDIIEGKFEFPSHSSVESEASLAQSRKVTKQAKTASDEES